MPSILISEGGVYIILYLQLRHIIRNSREVWRYSRSFHEQPRTCPASAPGIQSFQSLSPSLYKVQR
jgi:hypothetical protein